MNKITALPVLLLAIASVSLAEDFKIPPECEIIIDDFAHGIKPGWIPK
jgi:hypothetical protein